MQCEACKSREATVHFKQAADGVVREMHFCAECAAKKGLDIQAPLELTEFLFGVGESAKPAAQKEGAVCPQCRMEWKDFQKSSRLGCGGCYEAFGGELKGMVEDYQRSGEHRGKVPRRARASALMVSVGRQLDEAVAAQNFEQAAKLRDLLRDIKAGRTTEVQ